MTQACQAMTSHAIHNLQKRRVEIWADMANTKSCAIPERLGFKHEGTLRQRACYGNFYGDIAVYSALGTEWPVDGVGQS